MSPKRYIPLLLVLLTLGTFWQVRTHEFVNYDDPDYVSANPVVQAGLTQSGIAWAFQNIRGQQTYWHPLTWISHMLDVEMFGLKPAGHHLMNVYWHTLNVLLLFWLLTKYTGAIWRSALVAALFAVHPLQVDTVAWVTERKNLLSTFFFLATLLAYRSYAAQPKVARYLPVFALFALGLMCKPAIVVLPCVLLLLDFWPLRRFAWARPAEATEGAAQATGTIPVASPARLVLEKLPLLALSALSAWITVRAHEGLGMLKQAEHFALIYRLENAVVSYARYLGKVFWPAELAVLYPHPGAWPRWQVVASGFVLLLITDQVLRLRRKEPAPLIGWLWFLGALVPTIGLVQVGVQSMADRFAYLPLIGLFIAAVWGAAAVLPRLVPNRTALAFAGTVAIAACIAVSSRQLRHWQNSITLMRHATSVTKENAQAHHNLGAALMDEGKFDEAKSQFLLALKYRTNGFTFFALGQVAEVQRRTNEAAALYLEAARVAPLFPRARKQAALTFSQLGETNAAITNYAALLRVTPFDTEALFNMGLLLSGRGELEAAMKHYFEAIKIDPNHVASLNNLAWHLATATNAQLRLGPEAMGMALRACERTGWKQPEMIATLAAASAESGKLDEAIRLTDQAIALARTSRTPKEVADLEKMLKEFKAGRPYRDLQ